MRPDKHKQKRTAQYKKKHGIKDGSEPQAVSTTNQNAEDDNGQPQLSQNMLSLPEDEEESWGGFVYKDALEQANTTMDGGSYFR